MSRTTLGYFWQRPRTHRERVPDRVVSSLELFYDLVYVALIARVAQGLHGEITLGALATFCVLFGLLWVGWYNGSVLHDAHGRPDVRTRLLTFLQMFALASMAVRVMHVEVSATWAANVQKIHQWVESNIYRAYGVPQYP